MALKDWKKFKNGKFGYTFKNKTKKDVGLDYSVMIIKVFRGWNVLTHPWSKLNDRTFKTKSQALKFAKSYMRRH